MNSGGSTVRKGGEGVQQALVDHRPDEPRAACPSRASLRDDRLIRAAEPSAVVITTALDEEPIGAVGGGCPRGPRERGDGHAEHQPRRCVLVHLRRRLP